ncbi:MAG: beta-ketoacyl synthase N-terminal-like domain-containing protein [Rubripirellula sp.]
MPNRKVVITGLGVVSSIGIGSDAFFDALLNQKSGITSLENRVDDGAKPPADWESSQPAEHRGLWVGGPIIDFDAKQYVRPRKAMKVMCREIQICFAASQLAIGHAGLDASFPVEDDADSSIQPADIGTVFGSEMFYGPPAEMEDAMRECIDENRNFDASAFGAAAMKQVLPLWMLKYLPNMPACHVGISMNAQGPNNTLVLGDVSGPAAMIEAAGCLHRGIATVMVAGGVGTRVNTTRMNYRGDLPIAEAIEPIELSSRPYDSGSRGVVGGEAAATMVLENADAVAKRGGRVVASLVSHAARFVPSAGMQQPLRSAGNDQPQIRGSSDAISLAIEGALQSAGLSATDIGVLVGHGSGDPIMDKAEQDAIAKSLPGVGVISPAAAIGHTGAASGSVNLVTAALVIEKKMIPPTIGPATATCQVPVVRTATPLKTDYVMCLSHTSEGNAIAVILGSEKTLA